MDKQIIRKRIKGFCALILSGFIAVQALPETQLFAFNYGSKDDADLYGHVALTDLIIDGGADTTEIGFEYEEQDYYDPTVFYHRCADGKYTVTYDYDPDNDGDDTAGDYTGDDPQVRTITFRSYDNVLCWEVQSSTSYVTYYPSTGPYDEELVGAQIDLHAVYKPETASNVKVGDKLLKDNDSDLTRTKFQYRLSTTAAWSDDIPTAAAAGTTTVYWRLVDVIPDDPTALKSGSLSVNVTKNSFGAALAVSVTNDGWTYGDTAVDPVVSGVPRDYDGTPVFTYKVKDAGDTTYSGTVPTAAGNYTVKASFAADSRYEAASATANFTISKRPITVGGITAENKEYDGTTAAALVYTNITLDGSLAGDNVSATATGAFEDENAGDNKIVNITNYVLTGTDKGNYNVSGRSQTETNADITPASFDIQVRITGWIQGEYDADVNSPSITGNLSGRDVTYQYKERDADDDTYAGDVPADIGNYTVRATVAATQNYNEASATANFRISDGIERFTVIFKDGDTVLRTVENVEFGSLVEAPDPGEKDGKVFDGWYIYPALTVRWNLAADRVTDNITLCAKWNDAGDRGPGRPYYVGNGPTLPVTPPETRITDPTPDPADTKDPDDNDGSDDNNNDRDDGDADGDQERDTTATPDPDPADNSEVTEHIIEQTDNNPVTGASLTGIWVFACIAAAAAAAKKRKK